jgi:quercetin dioxygenase-like cupin family protein
MDAELLHDFNLGLTALPRRCLFCNDCVRVQLTGLRAGQSIEGTAPPRPLNLMVTFGTLHLEVGGKEFVAREGQMLTLYPETAFRLSADEAVDFLVLCQSCPAQREFVIPGALKSHCQRFT